MQPRDAAPCSGKGSRLMAFNQFDAIKSKFSFCYGSSEMTYQENVQVVL